MGIISNLFNFFAGQPEEEQPKTVQRTIQYTSPFSPEAQRIQQSQLYQDGNEIRYTGGQASGQVNYQPQVTPSPAYQSGGGGGGGSRGGGGGVASSYSPIPEIPSFNFDYEAAAREAYGELGPYYLSLLEDSRGDTNRALSRMTQDYETGVRRKLEDTQFSREGLAINRQQAGIANEQTRTNIVDNALARGLYQRSNFDPGQGDQGFGIPSKNLNDQTTAYGFVTQGLDRTGQQIEQGLNRYNETAALNKSRFEEDAKIKQDRYEKELEQRKRQESAQLAQTKASNAYQDYQNKYLNNPTLT